jgi:hypothetical protein
LFGGLNSFALATPEAVLDALAGIGYAVYLMGRETIAYVPLRRALGLWLFLMPGSAL